MDRIRNDAIRQKFGVAPIADKMREARLRWYGHFLRGREDSVRKIGLNFENCAATMSIGGAMDSHEEPWMEGNGKVQEQRQKAFQENINKRVLLEWVRVTGLVNKENGSMTVYWHI
ncbi:unnamed protein product [Heligmosomoides polygyrus]|uniref:HTH_48 domain-containing protein n=1 Tax=Heligmosomoides polygyrus TaxID=6339 RepID=A0A183FI92_HELPZ|nr:unnamed protein product [Heligmosomoides polygyrus]